MLYADEYVYHIPDPKHAHKYTKVKVLLVPKTNTHSYQLYLALLLPYTALLMLTARVC